MFIYSKELVWKYNRMNTLRRSKRVKHQLLTSLKETPTLRIIKNPYPIMKVDISNTDIKVFVVFINLMLMVFTSIAKA